MYYRFFFALALGIRNGIRKAYTVKYASVLQQSNFMYFRYKENFFAYTVLIQTSSTTELKV